LEKSDTGKKGSGDCHGGREMLVTGASKRVEGKKWFEEREK